MSGCVSLAEMDLFIHSLSEVWEALPDLGIPITAMQRNNDLEEYFQPSQFLHTIDVSGISQSDPVLALLRHDKTL
jgi:hypothetical protein